jgi:hypothetical protein
MKRNNTSRKSSRERVEHYMADATVREYRQYTPWTININYQQNKYTETHQSSFVNIFHVTFLQYFPHTPNNIANTEILTKNIGRVRALKSPI